jgi:hypothetical protein
MCNFIKGVAMLDFAYLALNVYQSPSDEKYLGLRPRVVDSIPRLMSEIEIHEGWFQLAFPDLGIRHEKGFHAELYAKVYNGKIQHFMTAFRGTTTGADIKEDVKTWWDTVLPNSEIYTQSLPDYWDYACAFNMNTKNVIADLDDEDLIAQYCGQHMTGHSLGGALANLVAARSLICKPANTKCILPVLPEIISFNPPGIAAMPIIESSFSQGMVISMRAHYDMVSALGKPYGFVVNNQVQEGNDQAKKAFEIETSVQSDQSLKQHLCDFSSICQSLERTDQALQVKAVYEQHLMSNFMKLILSQSNALGIPFTSVREWAYQHSRYNHDFRGPCMYSESVASVTA